MGFASILIIYLSQGTVPMSYIAEVYVKPWDPSDPRNQGLICTNTPIHPVHEDEEGNVYFRKQASVTSVSHGLSQQGAWVLFWTPKPLKRTPQDTQNICVEFLNISISSL